MECSGGIWNMAYLKDMAKGERVGKNKSGKAGRVYKVKSFDAKRRNLDHPMENVAL